MAVTDKGMIDAMGVSQDGKILILMLSDHLKWRNLYKHLMLLQEKLNSYIFFIENKQYQEEYPGVEFQQVIIEICFKYAIPKQGMEFLQTVQEQIRELGIVIKVE